MTGVSWSALPLVAGVVIGATLLLAVLCAGGIRLLAVAGRGASAARAAAWACFAVCGAAVLYGLWLLVPWFHGS